MQGAGLASDPALDAGLGLTHNPLLMNRLATAGGTFPPSWMFPRRTRRTHAGRAGPIRAFLSPTRGARGGGSCTP